MARFPADSPGQPENKPPAVASGGTLKISFKNENTLSRQEAKDGAVQNIAMVLDLIEALDTDN